MASITIAQLVLEVGVKNLRSVSAWWGTDRLYPLHRRVSFI